MRFSFLVFFAGCDSNKPDAEPEDSEPSTPEDTDPGDPSTGPPETETSTEPTLLEVTCAPTQNALRFQCTVEVEPAQPVELTFARQDGLSVTRTVSSDAVATSHVLPLYFMAPTRDYDVTAWATAWPGQVVTTSVTTGAPLVESSLAIEGTSTMGMIGTHFPCSSLAVAVVYDTATGDLLWYQLMDQGGQLGSLDMVQFTDDFTVLAESQGDVIEVDLMGTDILRLDALDDAFGVTADGAFGNFHHDIAKHDGVYAVFYQEYYGGSGWNADILDTVILFDGTGTELTRWYPIDHLPLPDDWGGDFLHTNTIFFDDNGDILLSWLGQSTIAKIEGDWTQPDFGTPIWTLAGGQGEVGNTITTDWSAIEGPSTFREQHSLIERPDGRLQLLDNANGRGLVISIDEATATATVDATYPTREDRCGPQGTSRSTLGGNAVVGCSGDWVREYDAGTGSMIWEAGVQCPTSGGFREGASRWYPLDGW
jgi:hypothetical protein